MPIPLEKGQAQKDAKEIARLQRNQAGRTKDIERALRKALQYSRLVDNGDEDARHDRDMCIDLAIDRGMDRAAIRTGEGMTGKLKSLLGHRPDSHSMAMGLLLVASDLLAGVDDDAAATVQQAIDKIERLTDADTVVAWKAKATPFRYLTPDERP